MADDLASPIGLEVLVERVKHERELNKTFRDAATDEFRTFKASLSKEIMTAAAAVDKELAHLNELRREVTTDRGLLVRIDKYDADVKGRDNKLDALEKSLGSRLELLERTSSERAHLVSQFGTSLQRLDVLERWQSELKSVNLSETVGKHEARIKSQEDWRNKLLGIGVMIALFAGLVGALLMRLFTGVFGK